MWSKFSVALRDKQKNFTVYSPTDNATRAPIIIENLGPHPVVVKVGTSNDAIKITLPDKGSATYVVADTIVTVDLVDGNATDLSITVGAAFSKG